jgi:hypothetical protein
VREALGDLVRAFLDAALRSGRAGVAPRDGAALGRGAAQPARDARGARGPRRAARRAREAAAAASRRRRRAPPRVCARRSSRAWCCSRPGTRSSTSPPTRAPPSR